MKGNNSLKKGGKRKIITLFTKKIGVG